MKRRTTLVVALVAAGLLVAAGIAYAVIPAASGEYHACMLKSAGTIRIIDPSLATTSLLGRCTSFETEITWNKQGPAGISPSVAQLASGNANCPAGGASITDAAGNTAYVCNGTNGTDGEDFAGTFTSANGQYKLEVTDTGITLQGPGSKVKLDGPNTQIEAAVDLELKGGASAKLEGSTSAEVRGGLVQLNGCGRHLVGVGDPVLVSPSTGSGQILPPGLLTVCAG